MHAAKSVAARRAEIFTLRQGRCVSRKMNKLADTKVHGMAPKDATIGLRVLRQDLPALNEKLRQVVVSNLR